MRYNYIMEKRTVSDYFHVIGLLLAAAYWIIESLVEDWILGEGSFLDRLFLIDAHEADHRLITTILIILFGFLAHAAFKKQKKAEEERRKMEERLQQSEEMFRSIVENSKEVFWISTPDISQMIYLSPAFEKIWGFPCEVIYEDPLKWVEAVHPEDADRLFKELESHREGKYDVQYRIARPDGDIRYIHDRGYPILDDKGQIYRMTGIAEDITEQKKAEEVIVRQRDELEKINSELSAIHQVSIVVTQTIDMEKLLSDVLSTVTELDILNVERKGVVFTIEGEALKLVYDLGHDDAFIGLHREMKVGDCLCGIAARSGEVMVSGDSTRDARHTIIYPGMTPHGHIIVPLKAEEKVIGVMCLYLPPGAVIDEGKRNMLVSIGNQVGMAMENIRHHDEIKALSLQDPLTGLGNRRYMEIRTEIAFARSRRYERPLSAIMLDIDFFKRYNDTYGHQAGDDMLVRVAKAVSKNIRETDFAARYGGEEFLVVLPETPLPEALEAAERIRKSVEKETGVTVSLGVACFQKEMKDKETLIKKADEALYIAKQKGRNRVEFL